MEISYTIDINTTPDKVFYWIGDPERAMVWTSNVSSYQVLHETPEMVGTTFVETVEDEGGRTEMHGVVTDFIPNQLIAFHLSGKYNVVDVEYRLEEIETGTCLTQHANIRFKSFLKLISLFMEPAFKKKNLSQLQSEFDRLKELCEEDA